MMYMLAVILLISIAVIAAIDFYPQFNTWQSRIKIGRWHDKKQWTQAIALTAKRWLRKTPVIKLTDNNRLIIIDMLRGKYKRKAIQHWQEAALVLALTDSYQISGNDAARQSVERFLTTKFDQNGQWKTAPTVVDAGILAYAAMRPNWIDPNFYKPAFDAMYQLILDHLDGDTVAYRKSIREFRFVDTIGFISPFLVRYGVQYKMQSAIELGCRQILEFDAYGMFPNENIPCHAYHNQTHLPSGLFGWGRGLGWYAIGIVDAYLELPNEHPRKAELLASLEKFAAMAVRFQHERGGWNWNILNKTSVIDSSATATLAYLLAAAPEMTQVPTARTAASTAIDYLMTVTRRSGAIDMAQGDTKDIGVYSQEFDILPFAQGFALRAFHQLHP